MITRICSLVQKQHLQLEMLVFYLPDMLGLFFPQRKFNSMGQLGHSVHQEVCMSVCSMCRYQPARESADSGPAFQPRKSLPYSKNCTMCLQHTDSREKGKAGSEVSGVNLFWPYLARLGKKYRWRFEKITAPIVALC